MRPSHNTTFSYFRIMTFRTFYDTILARRQIVTVQPQLNCFEHAANKLYTSSSHVQFASLLPYLKQPMAAPQVAGPVKGTVENAGTCFFKRQRRKSLVPLRFHASGSASPDRTCHLWSLTPPYPAKEQTVTYFLQKGGWHRFSLPAVLCLILYEFQY